MNPEFWVTLMTLLTGVITSIIAYLGKHHSKAANDAVNNIHPGRPKLYDIAKANSEAVTRMHGKVDYIGEKIDQVKRATDSLEKWRESYRDSPWKDGDGVKKWLEENGNSENQSIIRDGKPQA